MDISEPSTPVLAVTPKANTPVPVVSATSGVAQVKPVMPATSGAKPTPVSPVTPIKPTAPGAVSPVKPIVPGGAATLPVAPAPTGNMPMKPVSSIPATVPEGNKKSGTTVVKSAPPKETARITVKPSLPNAGGIRTGGNIPNVKTVGGVVAAGVAVPVAAAVVKGVAATPNPATKTKPNAAVLKSGTSFVPETATAATFEEESSGSTTLTTVLAGVLAVLTWGTAGVLFASYLSYI